MSVYSKLNEIKQIKENIKKAIVAKGVYVGVDVPFSDYPAKINDIGGGAVDNYAAINTYVAGDLSYTFANFDDYDYPDLNKYPKYAFLKEAALRADKFTAFKKMFVSAYVMNESDLFDVVSEVIQNSKDDLGFNAFDGMFEGMTTYNKIALNLTGVKDIKGMFSGALYLGGVNLSGTASVTNWIETFKNTEIDEVTGLDFSSATHLNNTFDNSGFTALDFSTTTNKLKYFKGITSATGLKTIENLNICGIGTDMDFSQNGQIERFTCQAGTITGAFKTLNLSNNNIGPTEMQNLVESLPTYAAVSESDRKVLVVTNNTGVSIFSNDAIVADLASKGWNVTI